MTLIEASRQFFLTFRAAEWFSSVGTEPATGEIIVTTRAKVQEPLDQIPHWLGWSIRWVSDNAAPPLLGAEWTDVEPVKKPFTGILDGTILDLASR